MQRMGRCSRTSYIYASDLKKIFTLTNLLRKLFKKSPTNAILHKRKSVCHTPTYLHVTKPCQNYDDSIARNRHQPLPPNQDRLIPPRHQSSPLRAKPDRDASFTIGAQRNPSSSLHNPVQLVRTPAAEVEVEVRPPTAPSGAAGMLRLYSGNHKQVTRQHASIIGKSLVTLGFTWRVQRQPISDRRGHVVNHVGRAEIVISNGMGRCGQSRDQSCVQSWLVEEFDDG